MVSFVDDQEVAIGTPSAAELGIIEDDGEQKKSSTIFNSFSLIFIISLLYKLDKDFNSILN